MISGSTIREALGLEDSKANLFAAEREYVLTRLNLMRVSCPVIYASRRENKAPAVPVVIEKNRNGVGFIEATGYRPKAIVVAGAARRSKDLNDGNVISWGWAEKGSLEQEDRVTISADKLIQMLQAGIQRVSYGGLLQAPILGQAWPELTAIYPFEGVVEYKVKDNHTRAGFTITADGTFAVVTPWAKTTNAVVGPNITTYRSYGAKNSELMMNLTQNWSDVQDTISRYLDDVKKGNTKQLVPGFAPVPLSTDGKLLHMLHSKGISLADFAIWSASKKASCTCKGKVGVSKCPYHSKSLAKPAVASKNTGLAATIACQK